MKYIAIIGLGALMVCGACSDTLEEKPQAIAVETFYNNANEIESGVNAIYAPLRSCFRDQYPCMLEESSDYIYGGLGSWEPPSTYQGLNSTNQSRVSGAWGSLYQAIRNANIMIAAIPNAQNASEADQQKYMGESRFLRALAYFHLVRNWGAVPLRTESNLDEIEIDRSPESAVYELITSDLEYAASALPATASVAGRATAGAAKLLLADVHFYLNNYEKAAQLTKEVIQSKQYSLVEVSTWEDFDNLFGANIVTTPEEVFYLKYHEQDGFSFAVYCHGGNIAGEYIIPAGYNVLISRTDYCTYQQQNDNDLRKSLWYEYEGGLCGPGTLLIRKYIDREGLSPRNSFPLYRYADCLLLFAEASCRTAGLNAEALEALNQVHRRAYGHPSTQPSPVDFKLADFTKESFIEQCIEERGYETVGEAKRWMDLKRLGKDEAKRYVKLHRGMDIAESHWLWPIPTSELNFNKAITTQNPGY